VTPAGSRRLAALGLLIATFAVRDAGQVQAGLSASADNAVRLSATALYEPVGLSGAPAGRTVPLTWTAASGGGNGNGYAVLGVNIGTNGATACPSVASGYTTYAGSTAGTSFTETGLAAGVDGTYVCYLGQTGYDPAGGAPWASAPAWTSAAVSPVFKTVIGFLPTSVTMTNGGLANTIDVGDTFVITFDQPVNTASVGTISFICAAVLTSTIYLGVTGGVVTCPTVATVGTLTGMPLSSALLTDGRYVATDAWSNGNRTLTIAVGALSSGWQAVSVAAGTEIFVPAAAITSATGAVAICTTPLCLPTTTTRP